MGWRVDPPGFQFDSRKKVGKFSVIVPGTGAMRRRKKTVEVATRDEALTKWREFHDEVTAPAAVPLPALDQWTFGRYVETHLRARKSRIRPATWASYAWVVSDYLLPQFGEQLLANITMPVVKDFAGSLSERGLSPATVNRILACLRMLIREAFERGCVSSLPLRGRMPMQKEPVLRLELSDDERRAFLRTFDDPEAFAQDLTEHRQVGEPHLPEGGSWTSPRRFGGGLLGESDAGQLFFERYAAMKSVFVVAFETGLRKGDLLSLRWSSVDLEQGWIRVVMQKTGREATIPISSACRSALAVLHARAGTSELVCTNHDGGHLSPTTFRRYFDRAKRLAGITRRFRVHDVRHTLGARLSSSGANLQQIAAVLGHSTARLSERYSRPSAPSLRAAFQRLEET